MKVYIITYQTEQCDKRVGADYLSLSEAKAEAERLDNATSWGSAGIVIRNVGPCGYDEGYKAAIDMVNLTDDE